MHMSHTSIQPIDISELSSINEDLDSVTAHVEYVQENIVELQNDLITLDDAKSDGDTIEAHAIITSSSPREAKYLLEHLLDMVLNLVCLNALRLWHCSILSLYWERGMEVVHYTSSNMYINIVFLKFYDICMCQAWVCTCVYIMASVY